MSAALIQALHALGSDADADHVRLVLEREQLSPAAVLSLVHQAIAADDARLVEIVLRARSATCDWNVPVLKDGKTLLHVAIAKRNLSIVRLLVDEGAKLTAIDKKGVRVADSVTWTDVVYPAVACPLQNRVFKLEQRNEALEDSTRAINEAAAKVTYAAQMTAVENENGLDELEESRRYRQTVLRHIDDKQLAVQEADDSILAHGPQSQSLAIEIEGVKEETAVILAQVQETKTDTARVLKECRRLRQLHAEQVTDLATCGKQCAVKCEAVQTVERFALDEPIQQRFLRALVVMTERVDAVKKLAMGGVQGRILDALVRHGHNVNVFCDGIQIILQFIAVKQKYPDDSLLAMYLRPWPAETLIRSLEESVVAQSNDESATRMLNTLIIFLQRLPHAHEQTETQASDLERHVRDVARRLLATQQNAQLELAVDQQQAIKKLAA